jgi:hypothetical protein
VTVVSAKGLMVSFISRLKKAEDPASTIFWAASD